MALQQLLPTHHFRHLLLLITQTALPQKLNSSRASPFPPPLIPDFLSPLCRLRQPLPLGRLLPYHPSLQPKFPSLCPFKTLLCEPRPVDGSEHLPSGVPTPRLQSATSENHLPLRTLKVTISLSSGPSSLPQSLSTFPRSALSFPLKWLFHFTFVTTVQGE